jgi:hypothetical protein
MVSAQKATRLVVALLVLALLAAFLMPVVIDSIAGPSQVTQTQNVNDTVELKPGIEVTVTGVTSGTSATYAINVDGTNSTGNTVNVGSNQTYTVNGADVNVAPTNVTSTQATTDYEYPTTYGWGSGASALWAILPVLLVLAVFLFVTYMAIQRM